MKSAVLREPNKNVACRRAAFVLVGGQSSRMGRDKALLPSPAGPLVKEIADNLLSVARNVALVGRPGAYRHLGYLCLEDVYPGYGPVSGIHAALNSRRGEYNLTLACDMPGISADLLRSLFECAEARRARCVVAEDAAGQTHPLCAVYHRSALEVLDVAIRSSRLCLMELLNELHAFHFKGPFAIRNCNTPEEWTAFQHAALQ